MGRARWIIVGIGLAFVVVVGVFALIFQDKFRPRVLGGPVAIVKGDVPKHGFLGVSFASPDVPLTIVAVYEGSGAEEAGLMPGDVVTGAGAAQQPDYEALQRVLRPTVPGDELPLTIHRKDQDIRVNVRLISFTEMVIMRDRMSRPDLVP